MLAHLKIHFNQIKCYKHLEKHRVLLQNVDLHIQIQIIALIKLINPGASKYTWERIILELYLLTQKCRQVITVGTCDIWIILTDTKEPPGNTRGNMRYLNYTLYYTDTKETTSQLSWRSAFLYLLMEPEIIIDRTKIIYWRNKKYLMTEQKYLLTEEKYLLTEQKIIFDGT